MRATRPARRWSQQVLSKDKRRRPGAFADLNVRERKTGRSEENKFRQEGRASFLSFFCGCVPGGTQFRPRHSQSRAYGAHRRFATIFAHKMALASLEGPSSARAIRKAAPAAFSVASRLSLLIKWRLRPWRDPVQPAPFAKPRWRAYRCFAAVFAHKKALPQPPIWEKFVRARIFPDFGGWLNWG